jgi:sulfide:quinone oxidoreductase
VLAGQGAQYLEHALHGGAGHGPPAELRLWSAAHKVEGRYLSPWLEELEDTPAGASAAPPAAPAEGDVVVDVPLGLDPYSPVPQR